MRQLRCIHEPPTSVFQTVTMPSATNAESGTMAAAKYRGYGHRASSSAETTTLSVQTARMAVARRWRRAPAITPMIASRAPGAVR